MGMAPPSPLEGLLDPTLVDLPRSLARVSADHPVLPVEHVDRGVAGDPVSGAQGGLVDRRALYTIALDELPHFGRIVLPVYADHDHAQAVVLALELAYDRRFLLAVRAPGGEEDEHRRPGLAPSHGDVTAADRLGGEARGLLADRDQTLVIGREVLGAGTAGGVEHRQRRYRDDDERCEPGQN